MRRRGGLLLFLVIILSAAVFLAGCNNDANKHSNSNIPTNDGSIIKIGFLGGENGYGGSECLKGIQIAVNDLNNAGGLLGKKVELVEGDHHSNSSEAVKVTQELIDQNVVAVIGDNTTGISKLAATVCQSNNVVLVSPTATGSGVVELGDYIFRISLLDSVAVPAVTNYLANELGWKKVALVKNVGRTYTEGLTALFKPSLVKNGIKILTEQKIRKNDTNFSAQVAAIKKNQFDGLIFPGNNVEAYLFMKEMRKQGLQQVAIGGDGLYTRELIKNGGQAVEGTMAYAGFAVDLAKQTDQTKDFVEKYRTKNNGLLPDVFSAQAYDAVNLVADAITKTKSVDPAIFKEELAKTTNWQGISGIISFDEDREPVKSPVYLMEVRNGEFILKSIIPIINKT